ncbi:GGDEF domain-containing protein [Halomonas ramblicola]|uniref:GGDEF domain-containing protein n=1 Tax=Halomonas ramblicola TaxID=747349 RepID=UPI0025B4A768|nr:diguanylate cyclase [Halomonas ramblicola]MDN3520654.1 diguanylate cyclase [Halomonas ramblicola]
MPISAADLAQWWNSAPTGQVVIDEQGVILFVNRTLSDWLERPARALVDRSASELFTPASRMLYLGLLAYRLAERGQVDEVHLALRLPDDTSMPVLCSGRQVEHRGARLALLSLLPIPRKDRLERELLDAREATQRALAEKDAVIAELEELQAVLLARREELETVNGRLGAEAITDPLTGLPNRRCFERVLNELMRQAGKENEAVSTFALALLDVDHFKAINDRLGHTAGDRVLERLAALLSATLRAHDLVARIGGEEFALLMLHTTPEAARHAMERLRQSIAEHVWNEVEVTVSIGLSGYRPGDTPERLFQRADAALYSAKHAGRNLLADG